MIWPPAWSRGFGSWSKANRDVRDYAACAVDGVIREEFRWPMPTMYAAADLDAEPR
jgi:hypothetical protein